MLKTKQVVALLDEARVNSADSLARLDDATKHWDKRELLRSAEKAWAAANQATNALILARTGIEPKPGSDADTYGLLSRLAKEVPGLEDLKDRYAHLSVYLFDLVLCNGSVDPLDFTIHDIRDTADYIRDAERLAREAP